MITIEDFKGLAIAIRDKGSVVDRKIDGEFFKVCEINEMKLVLTQYRKGWIPEGIIFQLFGEDFYLTPNGSISVTSDAEEENENVFSLSDDELLSVISSFLRWRLKVLTALKV